MSEDIKTATTAAAPGSKSKQLAVILLAAGLVILGYMLLAQTAYSQDAPQTHVIEISGFEFQPAELTVRQGDTVMWINRDPLAHTTTASDGAWDSGLMSDGDEWEYVADAAGVFDYACTPHPQMTGSITVEAQ